MNSLDILRDWLPEVATGQMRSGVEIPLLMSPNTEYREIKGRYPLFT